MSSGPPELPLSGNRRFGVSPSFVEALAEHGPENLRPRQAPQGPPGATLSVPHEKKAQTTK